ncbi:MinD/ParA family protein [Bacillus salipaludis]|uniref:MinD/ParA family protein n=1 Tax=Bacillus salipaludis TaxID=2547811 RepID=UPI003D1EB808
MDQAQSLREYMHRYNIQQEKKQSSRVITITSGKGGVGKSNFTLNFALGLKAVGKKVVILDLDLSTANINILMGISSRYRLADVLKQRKGILDVIEKGIEGIEYIYGGMELDELLKLDQGSLSFFMSQLQELQAYADFILLDTGAGISKELVNFILGSDETILVTTPEPTSIADCYAVLKTVVQYSEQSPRFRLVVNRAQSYREAVETSKRLQNACYHFLKLDLKTLGHLLEDQHVRKSVKAQTPFYITYPNCTASKNMKQIVYSYLPDLIDTSSVSLKGIQGFFERILSLGKSS